MMRILLQIGDNALMLPPPPKPSLADLDRALAMDDANFEESKHPRSKDGKFTSGAAASASANALSSSEKSYIVNSHVGLLIKAAGFKKAKTDDGLLTFQHPSGAKVIVHPPANGKKSSSKWMLANETGSKSGEGIAIAKVLGVAVQKAEGGKVKPAEEKYEVPNVAAPKMIAGETIPAVLLKHKNADGSVNLKSYLAEKNYSFNGLTAPDIFTFKKENGGKVEVNSKTGDWLASTPGFQTKEGNGGANLAKLLEGGKAEQKDGKWSWQNSSKTSLVVDPAEAANAEKAAAEKVKKAEEAAAKTEAEHKKQQEMQAVYNVNEAKLAAAAKKPDDKQENAISSYAGSGYTSMNKHLRSGGELTGKAKVLNDWLMQNEFPEDMTVYRKVASDYASIVQSILGPGAKFFDKGFSSTSTHAGVWEGELHFKINVKKGQKGAGVQQWSDHKSEHEAILPANTAFIVTGYDPASHEVEVEVDQSHFK
jgi:hypothetical protein